MEADHTRSACLNGNGLTSVRSSRSPFHLNTLLGFSTVDRCDLKSFNCKHQRRWACLSLTITAPVGQMSGLHLSLKIPVPSTARVQVPEQHITTLSQAIVLTSTYSYGTMSLEFNFLGRGLLVSTFIVGTPLTLDLTLSRPRRKSSWQQELYERRVFCSIAVSVPGRP